jgi:hypothetical protein
VGVICRDDHGEKGEVEASNALLGINSIAIVLVDVGVELVRKNGHGVQVLLVAWVVFM